LDRVFEIFKDVIQNKLKPEKIKAQK